MVAVIHRIITIFTVTLVNKIITIIPYNYLVYAIAYLSFMSIFGLIIFGISLSNKFDRPKYTKLKGILFLMLGISAGAAIVHINFFQ